MLMRTIVLSIIISMILGCESNPKLAMQPNHEYEAQIKGEASGNSYQSFGFETWEGQGFCLEFSLLKSNYIGPWPSSVGAIFVNEELEMSTALRLYSRAPNSDIQYLKIETYKENSGYLYKEILVDGISPSQSIQVMVEFPKPSTIRLVTSSISRDLELGFSPEEITFNIVSSKGLISYGGNCI